MTPRNTSVDFETQLTTVLASMRPWHDATEYPGHRNDEGEATGSFNEAVA